MVAKKKEPGKQLPGFSIGVRENAAIRDVIVAQPICPNSQIRGKMVDGHYEAPEIGPGDENCQLAGWGWWTRCEELGHNPYFMTRERVVTRPKYEEDADGDMVLVSEKKVLLRQEVLNVTSVSPAPFFNSGGTIRRKMQNHGFKRLGEFGYDEVCQFRSCQKPIRIKNSTYGNYCSMDHLQLSASRIEEAFLTRTDHPFLAGKERRAERKRKGQLRNAVEGIVDPVFADVSVGTSE